jgi:hypothetical protein
LKYGFIFNNELNHVGFFSVVSSYSYFHSNKNLFNHKPASRQARVAKFYTKKKVCCFKQTLMLFFYRIIIYSKRGKQSDHRLAV